MKGTGRALFRRPLAVASLLLLALSLVPVGAMGETGGGTGSPQFSIAIYRSDTLLFEQEYTWEELTSLPWTRQRYTSMNDDGSAELILAEGVLFSDLLARLELEQEDLKAIRVYSSEGWNRGFVPNFLLGSTRYFYPDYISPLTQESKPEEAQGEQTAAPPEEGGREDGLQTPQEGTAAPAEATPASAVPATTAAPIAVTPMLALRTYQGLAADGENWENLQSEDGIRICYGQLTAQDVCSTLYGSNLNRIEFTLKETSRYGLAEGEQPSQAEDGVVITKDNYNDSAVTGQVTDPQTNAAVGEIPSALTIRIGYFGYEYQEIKTVSIEEIKQLPVVKQAYTLRSGNDLIVETAMGVRLSDLLALSGIEQEQIKYYYFYTVDSGDSPKLEISKSALMDTRRFYYPMLPTHWDSAAGTPLPGAAVGAVEVEPILAFRDFWDVGATAPDFFAMNGMNRFRLVLGQLAATTENASQCVSWINTIEVMLDGAPPAAGDGGTGAPGVAAQSGGSGEGSAQGETTVPQLPELLPAEQVISGETESMEETDGSSRQWHLYEVTDLERVTVQEKEKAVSPLWRYGGFAAAPLLGAILKFRAYRKELEEV